MYKLRLLVVYRNNSDGFEAHIMGGIMICLNVIKNFVLEFQFDSSHANK